MGPIGEVREAGRDHDGLLGAADEAVDAPLVHIEVGGAEAGDGVNDQEGFGARVLEELRDGGRAVANAGGGLGGLHEDAAGFKAEGGFDFVEREGLSIRGGDDVDLAAEGLGESRPALTELAGGEDEDAITGGGEVRDSGFHGSGAGAGENDDVACAGADELLELGEDAGVEGAELGGAVMDVGSGHGELGSGKQGRWAGSEEACFADHVCIVSRVEYVTSKMEGGVAMSEQEMNSGAVAAETGAKPVSIAERIEKDIVTAMKAREEHLLTTLRMVKSALKSKAIDKRDELTEGEQTQILKTLVKQRNDSVESFTKGGRPELAEKERLEIAMIEGYLPQSASEDEVRAVVHGAIAHMGGAAGATKPGPKDMGAAMGIVKQRLMASGLNADGKMVSELVKAELAK